MWKASKTGKVITALLLILLPGSLLLWLVARVYTTLKEKKESKMTIYQLFVSVFKSKGIPEKVARMAYIQAGHETAGFTSRLFIDHNNIGGYTYRGQKGATKGRPLPENPKVFYAKYDSLKDSIYEQAGYYGRKSTVTKNPRHFDIASMGTLSQFAQYLRNEKYYTDSVSNYARGLYHYEKSLSYA